jgi:hypothetical protein
MHTKLYFANTRLSVVVKSASESSGSWPRQLVKVFSGDKVSVVIRQLVDDFVDVPVTPRRVRQRAAER